MFQAVMNPTQRRNFGAHYTSEKNIQKVIKPLFLDDLYTEFEKVKNNQNKLKEFHEKIANLKFLDPACGCGNFLIVSYRELRDLEILVLQELNKKGQLELDINNIIKVDVDQFFGIEYDEFAVRIAEVAMWLIDHQMNIKVSNEFGQYFVRLPLKKSAKIVHGNALQIDWHSLLNSPPLKEGLGVVDSKSLKEGLGVVDSKSLKEGLGVIELTSGKETKENYYPTYKSISNLKDKKELRKSLRNNATSAERLLWKALQGKQLDGFKFRRQHSIGNYILDFFCPSANLAIELDGESHYTPEAQEYDRIRDNFLTNVGIRVIRYHNHDVFDNLTGVLEDIRQHINNSEASSTQGKSITSNSFYIAESTTPNPSYIGGEKNAFQNSSPFNEKLGGVNNFNFIFGNPPFVGKNYQNKQQKADMNKIFTGVQNAGNLDYVCAWYIKASQFIKNTKIKVAFVSTSSICQGQQVGILWQELLSNYKIKIHFAHRTFSWSNEAKGNAAVHCIIVGFANFDIPEKRLFDYLDIRGEATEKPVKNINPYLVEANDIVINKRRDQISNLPEMKNGSKPADGGFLILTEEEKKEFLAKEKKAEKYLLKYIGSAELINGNFRYCLWLKDISPSELRSMPLVRERIDLVRDFRSKSVDKNTQKWADYPSLFQTDRQPKGNYIAIPSTSSENRKYIPISFFSSEIIISNSCLTVPNADLFLFGILTSEMHMTWVKYVCGRLESRFRYSKDIVYNNYPFPENVTEKQREKVANLAQKILDIRSKYTSPNPSLKGGEKEASLADLYDPLSMPPDLLKAHQALDKIVDLCYTKQSFSSELNRIEFLFNLYEQINTPLLKPEKKKTRKK